MTNKEILNGLAARIGQIKVELKPVWNSPDISLAASHEAGVLLAHLNLVESKLIKLAGNV